MTESVSLENFINGPYFIKIKGVEYELSEWTLRTELWAKRKYGSVQKFYNLLTGNFDVEKKMPTTDPDLEAQLEFVLFMLKDKKNFATIDDLAASLDHAEFAGIYDVLHKILSDSAEKVKKRNESIKAMQK